MKEVVCQFRAVFKRGKKQETLDFFVVSDEEIIQELEYYLKRGWELIRCDKICHLMHQDF